MCNGILVRPFAALLGALVTALGLFAATAVAQVPATMNYQGRLLQNTEEQTPIDSTVDIVFSIWTGPASDASANQLWSENWNDVALSNGIFSVLLGSNGSALVPAHFQANPMLYLQLVVDGETLLPRQQLGSVPFAMVDEPGNELQELSRSGTTLNLSGSDSSVDLGDLAASQQLSLAGTTLSLSNGGSVSLAPFVNTDNQNLANVLTQGNNAGNRNIVGVGLVSATDLDCPNCVTNRDIANDTIFGNNITDDIYIVHIDCNGSCINISMRQACDVIAHQANLPTRVELMGVSCTHGVPSTAGNGFVPCDDGNGPIGNNECRAFNLRTLGDIPCIDGNGTDAIVTCWRTNLPR